MSTPAELRVELMKRRRDPNAVKHPYARYFEIMNQAIREAPRSIWALEADYSLTTVDSTRRYSLASLTGLASAGQVRGVFLEDSDGNHTEIGRWRIEDNGGALTLILDVDPPAADRELGIWYASPFSELDIGSAEDVTIDVEWFLSKCMVLLMLDADPTLEDANMIDRSLRMWDARRAAREKQIQHRVRPRKARTFPWREVVSGQTTSTTTSGDDEYLILE